MAGNPFDRFDTTPAAAAPAAMPPVAPPTEAKGRTYDVSELPPLPAPLVEGAELTAPPGEVFRGWGIDQGHAHPIFGPVKDAPAVGVAVPPSLLATPVVGTPHSANTQSSGNPFDAFDNGGAGPPPGAIPPPPPPPADANAPTAPPPDTMSGLTPAQLHAKFDNLPMGLQPGLTTLSGQGLTAGLGNEIYPLVKSAVTAIAHPIDTYNTGGQNVADAYHQARTNALAQVDYARMQHPDLATPVEVGSAFINPIGMEAKAAAMPAVAGGYGIASGFEDNNGSLNDRLGAAGTHGAIGTALGAAMPVGLAAAKGAINSLPGRSVASGLTQAFDRTGVTPLAAYVGGIGSRMASGALGMTFGGMPIGKAVANTIEQARAARDAIATRMGSYGDTASAGARAQKGLQAWLDSTKGKVASLYHAVPIPGTTNAVTHNTVTTLQDLTKPFESNPELSSMVQDKTLARYLEAIKGRTVEEPTGLLKADGSPITRTVQKGGKLSWEDMKDFRTRIGEKLDGVTMQSDTSQKALKGLYKALSGDLEATAGKLGPKALAAAKRADNYYRARADRIEKVVTPILGAKSDAGPQAAFNQIQSWASHKGETVRLAQMMRSLPEDEASTVRATIFSRLGNSTDGHQNWDGTAFSPSTFGTMWNKMDPAARSALFPGQQYRQDISDLFHVTEAMKKGESFANHSKTGLAVGASTLAGMLFKSPVWAVSEAVGSYGLGHLMASPKFARWLAAVPKKPNQAAMLAHVQRLNALAAANPALAASLHSVQERFAAAIPFMNDNTAVSAAAAQSPQNQQSPAPVQ